MCDLGEIVKHDFEVWGDAGCKLFCEIDLGKDEEGESVEYFK